MDEKGINQVNAPPEENTNTQPPKKQKITGAEKGQKRLFKKRRGGVVLTEYQVKEIKEGRKKLRKQMKEQGIKSKKEFELTASSLGLYFDKRRWLPLLLWWLHGGRALWALLGALLALLGAAFLFSLVSQLRGNFTINLGDDMFRNGFILSEDEAFAEPKPELFSDPVHDVPCTSIRTIPEDVYKKDGSNNDTSYFAYTFYLKNEGEEAVDYTYELCFNSESKNLSKAAWVMLFMDDEMTFYAENTADGKPEALPAYGDDTRGYGDLPLFDVTADKDAQYEEITTTSMGTYYRVVPKPFKNDDIVTDGVRTEIETGEIHKYTVVIWLEGDDPDCTNDLIGGHLGAEMNFELVGASDGSELKEQGLIESIVDTIKSMSENLKFWEE